MSALIIPVPRTASTAGELVPLASASPSVPTSAGPTTSSVAPSGVGPSSAPAPEQGEAAAEGAAQPGSDAVESACPPGSIYGNDQTGAIFRIDVSTGTKALVATAEGMPDGPYNGLGVSPDGSTFHLVRDGASPTWIYTVDAATGATRSTPSGIDRTEVNRGAVDPVDGRYYWSPGRDAAPAEFRVYDPSTDTAFGDPPAFTSEAGGFMGASGDLVFDRLGNLYLLQDSHRAGDHRSAIYRYDAPLPTASEGAVVPRSLVATIPSGAMGGIAFGGDGYLYASSSTKLYKVDPATGAVVSDTALTGIVDLASCVSTPTLELHKVLISRVGSDDQFALALTGQGYVQGGDANTGLTRGTDLGPQDDLGEVAGPVPVREGLAYTVTETGSPATLEGYDVALACRDVANGGAVVPIEQVDVGVATVVIPTATVAPNVVCTYTNRACGSAVGCGASIELTKTASRSTFTAAGDRVSYELVATNTGAVDLRDARIDDPMTGLGRLICDRPVPAELPVGGALRCTAEYRAIQADVDRGTIRNVATATATSPSGTGVAAQATAATTWSPSPRLVLDKSVDRRVFAGAEATLAYRWVATNTGSATLIDVEVSDPLDGMSALDCAPALPVTLLPGGHVTCTGTYVTTPEDVAKGAVSSTGVVTGTDLRGNVVAARASASSHGRATTGAIRLTKTADRTTFVMPGDVISYRLTASNVGAVPLTDVDIADDAPGLSRLACQPSIPARLAPGASLTCTATAVATAADVRTGRVVNDATATAWADGAPVPSSAARSVVVRGPIAPGVPPGPVPVIGSLPMTGNDSGGLVGIAVVLVVGGAVLCRLGRARLR